MEECLNSQDQAFWGWRVHGRRVAGGRWLSGEAMLQLQTRAHGMLFCVDMETMLPLFVARWALTLLEARWCRSCTCRTDSGGGKEAKVVPSHPVRLPAGVATCLYILLYLFICLDNQLRVTFPSWRCSFFVPSRKKESKGIRMVLYNFL